jgi:hypothetical protein
MHCLVRFVKKHRFVLRVELVLSDGLAVRVCPAGLRQNAPRLHPYILVALHMKSRTASVKVHTCGRARKLLVVIYDHGVKAPAPAGTHIKSVCHVCKWYTNAMHIGIRTLAHAF